MSDDDESDEGAGLTAGGDLDFSFCVFPSLTPPASKAAAVSPPTGGYVPWELTALPWQRLAKWMHKKYLVGILVPGEPSVLVIQTTYAPEHPKRAALRSKTLLGWVATELGVAGGEVRTVLRAKVEGAGQTMEEQVSAAQEAQATEAVLAFLADVGEGEPSTCEAVIACLTAMELEPPEWLPYLEGLRDKGADAAETSKGGEEEAEEEDDDEDDEEGPTLLDFIESVKKAIGDVPPTPLQSDLQAEEEEEEEEAQGEEEAAAAAAEAEAAAAAREQLDERAAIAARLMEDGRGMGLVSREELRGLLQRCAEADGVAQAADGSFPSASGQARWEDWEEQLWAPPKARMERETQEKPPPGLTPKELKKWQKQHGQQERDGDEKPPPNLTPKELKKWHKRQATN